MKMLICIAVLCAVAVFGFAVSSRTVTVEAGPAEASRPQPLVFVADSPANRCGTRVIDEEEQRMIDREAAAIRADQRKINGGDSVDVTGGVINVYVHVIHNGTAGDVPD